MTDEKIRGMQIGRLLSLDVAWGENSGTKRSSLADRGEDRRIVRVKIVRIVRSEAAE